MATRTLAMFPLGNPLLPGESLPLRIFETRYRAMLDDLAASGTTELGVVLIARGSEVGGGDERRHVGCAARFAGTSHLEDGSIGIVVTGTGPIRIDRWLPDDPYPIARVVDMAEVPEAGGDGLAPRVDEVAASVAKIYALASELGVDVAAVDRAIPDEPVTATWRIASLLPLGAYDRQQVLERETTMDRIELLDRLAGDIVTDLAGRLGAGG